MKQIVYILVFFLIVGIVFADEYTELKNLVREGDKALMDEIQSQSASCTQKVDERYNEFVGGIESRVQRVFFIERISLLVGIVFVLLFAWGFVGAIEISISKKRAKGFLLKMQNMENMINEVYQLLQKKEPKKAIKKYKQIKKLYISLDAKGQRYIYQKVLDIQKVVMQYGRI